MAIKRYISNDSMAVRADSVVAYYECDEQDCAAVHIEMTTGKEVTMNTTWAEFDASMREVVESWDG